MTATLSHGETRATTSVVASQPPRRRPRVAMLVPAHNEEISIEGAVRSLLTQTYPIDRLIVACDNCTDRTVEIVRGLAAQFPSLEVFETVGNPYRKAGALNQAWARLRPGEIDYVASMDADTALAPEFVEQAVLALDANPNLGGVCATPTPRPDLATTWWSRVLWRMQRAEYSRYVAILRHKRWQVHVLSGAGAVYRSEALVDAARRRTDGPWSHRSLTEDYLLTLDLRASGWDACMSLNMRAYTDAPTSLRELWRQRLRWASGTIDDLRTYGWQPYTRRAILAHLMAALAVVVRLLFAVAIGWALLGRVGFHFHWVWLFPPLLTAAERAVSLKDLEDKSWADTLQAVLILPEELFAVFREAYMVRSAVKVFFGKLSEW